MEPYDLAAIFTSMELDMIKSFKRTFYKHKQDELKEGFEWEQWQLEKLRSMRKFRKDNADIIKAHSSVIEQGILDQLSSNYKKGYENTEKIMQKAKKIISKILFPKDVKLPPKDNKAGKLPKSPANKNFFGMNDKKLNALIDSINNDLKQGQAAMLRQADDVYRQTIYKTHMYLQSGNMSLNQAIDMATNDFLEKGFNCIVFKNKKRMNIASYSEMALRTASQRATFMGEGKKRDEWGTHLVVTTAHNNTCSLCLPWQGKVLIDDVYSSGSKDDGDYPKLSQAMAAGFMHPNCRHTVATYFPGITELPEPVDDKEALGNYQAEQKQRHMERQIRKWKRFQEGSCDPENQSKAAEKDREWQGKLKEHLRNNPQLRRDSSREKVDVRSIKEINYAKDSKQYEKYRVILGDKASKTLDDFQELKYNNSKGFSELKNIYSEHFVKTDFKDIEEAFKYKLSDLETRQWYIWHDKNIPNLIDESKAVEEQARQAHELRNTYRTQARDLMKDQVERRKLDVEHPNIEFEDLIKSKMDRKKLTRQDAISDILKTATKTNKEVNKSLGLE